MNIKQLEYFVAVAEELHFGRAAERLGIAQPPLSRQIKQIEDSLGARLLNRGRSSVTLTQAGERLYERTKDILNQLEDTRLEIRRIGQGAEGRLRIGFVGSATYGMFPNILKSFRINFPDVNLSLTPMNNAELHHTLIRREIDIAIARPKLKDAEIISLKLVREPLILAAPDTLNLGRSDQVDLAALAKENFVLYPERPRPSFADHIIKLCDTANIDIANRTFTMDFQAAMCLVTVGEGVSVVPASVAAIRRNGVRFYGIISPKATTELSLNYRIDEQGVHIKKFIDIAVRIAKSPVA